MTIRKMQQVKEKLEEIFNILDNYLGDTDPMFDEDISDEDIKQEEPVFWCTKELHQALSLIDEREKESSEDCIYGKEAHGKEDKI